MIRVVVANGSHGELDTTVLLLNLQPDIDVTATVASAANILDAVRDFRPDVLVIDVWTPEIDRVAAACRAEMPDTAVVMPAGVDEPGIVGQGRGCSSDGASFFELADAVRRAHHG